jgi:hypothetical protein
MANKQNAEAGFAAAHGSAAHVGMWMRTAKGNVAHVLGDPKMPKRTAQALAEMFDCLSEAMKRNKRRAVKRNKSYGAE